jgi:hypothetical protein
VRAALGGAEDRYQVLLCAFEAWKNHNSR